jgi:hypothetical protein
MQAMAIAVRSQPTLLAQCMGALAYAQLALLQCLGTGVH